MFSDFDRFAMQRALTLAARGLETADPNPRVGCVIAQRGRIVGEGWHERAGEAHAEVAALRAAGAQAAGRDGVRDARAVQSSRPHAAVRRRARSRRGWRAWCTPSTIRIRWSTVRRAQALRAAGIAVEVGLLAGRGARAQRRLLQAHASAARPWVRVKLAMSLDGRTALANGASHWITGEAARADVQRWRARSSAILTGIGTVLADDPRLNVRLRRRADGRGRASRCAWCSIRACARRPTARLFPAAARC